MIEPSKRPAKGSCLSSFATDYCVIDIETTGFGGALEIIELSALKVRDLQVTDAFSTLVKPDARVNYFVTQLTGITDAMARGGADLAPALRDYRDFIGSDVLIGYNVNFDINAIYDNMMRCFGSPLSNDYIDVLRLARRALPQLPDHKQTTVAGYLGIDIVGAHRAAKDCMICNGCYLSLSDMLSRRI